MFGCGLVHTCSRTVVSTARHHRLSSFVCRESHRALIEFRIGLFWMVQGDAGLERKQRATENAQLLWRFYSL